jgi:hypothetical protein
VDRGLGRAVGCEGWWSVDGGLWRNSGLLQAAGCHILGRL